MPRDTKEKTESSKSALNDAEKAETSKKVIGVTTGHPLLDEIWDSVLEMEQRLKQAYTQAQNVTLFNPSLRSIKSNTTPAYKFEDIELPEPPPSFDKR